ncbi:MAG: hypothetical protein JWN34_3851 [Bryobacterales bacterium]|nr:hypothetical protein [Bryobacterales bacterium]
MFILAELRYEKGQFQLSRALDHWLVVAVTGAMAALAGCVSHRSVAIPGNIWMSYRLEPNGPGDILIPPGEATEVRVGEVSTLIGLPLSKLASLPCSFDSPEWKATLKGTELSVRLRFQAPDENRTPLRLVQDLERFRLAFHSREFAPCLGRQDPGALAAMTADDVPAPSRLSAYLHLGAYPVTDFVEIRPGMLLDVYLESKAWAACSTVFAAGADIRGFLRFSERSSLGNCPTNSNASAAMQPLWKDLSRCRLVRLYLLTRRSVADHDVIFVGASSGKLLAGLPSPLTAGSGTCDKVPRGVVCRAAPAGSVVYAKLAVQVDGIARMADLGGTVGDLFPDVGSVKWASVAIHRSYHGGSIPVRTPSGAPEMLRAMTLIGGEVVSTR